MKALLILIGGLAMAFAISLDTNGENAMMEMEMEMMDNLTTTPVEDIDLASVPKELFDWNGNQYCYFPTTLLMWGDAEALCQRWGGHLASINSFSERDYLHSKLKNRPEYWIGFIDHSGKNTGYQWTDGSGGFTHWHEGEPNLPGKQLCAKVWTKIGTWDNYYCSAAQRALCKKPQSV